MSSVAIKELSQQRSRHLVRAANLLRRRTQHLRDVRSYIYIYQNLVGSSHHSTYNEQVSEKQWVLLHNLQSVRKAWRIVATSRGKVGWNLNYYHTMSTFEFADMIFITISCYLRVLYRYLWHCDLETPWRWMWLMPMRYYLIICQSNYC